MTALTVSNYTVVMCGRPAVPVYENAGAVAGAGRPSKKEKGPV